MRWCAGLITKFGKIIELKGNIFIIMNMFKGMTNWCNSAYKPVTRVLGNGTQLAHRRHVVKNMEGTHVQRINLHHRKDEYRKYGKPTNSACTKQHDEEYLYLSQRRMLTVVALSRDSLLRNIMTHYIPSSRTNICLRTRRAKTLIFFIWFFILFFALCSKEAGSNTSATPTPRS